MCPAIGWYVLAALWFSCARLLLVCAPGVREHTRDQSGDGQEADQGSRGVSTLPGRLPSSVHIDNHPLVSQAVPQSARRRAEGEASQQVLQKEGPQRLYAGLIQCSQVARKRCRIGEIRSAEKGHEYVGKRMDSASKRRSAFAPH